MSAEIPTPQTLRIGVLYEQVQMSDLVGLDIIGNLSVKVMNLVAGLIPEAAALSHLAVPMEFLYISSSLSPAWMSPEMFVRPTHTYANAPRDLDILFLGGPDPMGVSEESLVFIREAVKQTKVVLSTCTGGMWLARSGVLDGKKATTNRILLPSAKKFMPNVDWQDQRWVVEEGHFEGAQIWTAGGAGCGKSDSRNEYEIEHRLIV
jgi:transcriptional regulator GlxA family with amidase domain